MKNIFQNFKFNRTGIRTVDLIGLGLRLALPFFIGAVVSAVIPGGIIATPFLIGGASIAICAPLGLALLFSLIELTAKLAISTVQLAFSIVSFPFVWGHRIRQEYSNALKESQSQTDHEIGIEMPKRSRSSNEPTSPAPTPFLQSQTLSLVQSNKDPSTKNSHKI